MTLPQFTPKEIEQFWSRVHKAGTEECWEWQKRVCKDGYGSFDIPSRLFMRAHRVAYFLHYGVDPENLCVLHRCDNRLCVNPSHLFLGTRTDNARDRTSKGREARGEQLPASKLTADMVRTIRKTYAETGCSQASLAREYGIDVATMCHILHRRLWKHV